MKMPIKNLCLSPIGDFMCISGDGVMSIWGRDSEALGSFSNMIYYSRDEVKGIMSSIIK